MAKESVVITVHAGARQTFKGLGTSQSIGGVTEDRYDELPQQVRDAINKELYDTSGCNFNYLRIWATIEDAENDLHYGLAPYVDDARKWNPDLTVFLGPNWYNFSDLPAYTQEMARRIKQANDEWGFNIRATGIDNEPDNSDQLVAPQVPIFIKMFRKALDAQGLNYIRIIAPENTSADPKACSFVQAIIDDPEALGTLNAFATHSYNSSITDEMEDLVEPHILNGGKEYWQTESSDFIYEQWNDDYAAASALSRYLADMNHLCSVWIFYFGIQGVNQDNYNWNFGITGRFTGFYLILWRTDVLDFRKLLKCWYFRQMGKTIVAGAVFRKSVTNLMELNAEKYWRREDTSMAYAFGRKSPLYLGAAVNPDGSWGIGITNYTGVKTPPEQPELTSLFSATDYRITVRIEELRDAGTVRFSLHRVNAEEPFIHQEDSLTMVDGEMVIDSIGSFDLLCLRSNPGVSAIKERSADAGAAPPGGFKVRYIGTNGAIKRYAIEFTAGVQETCSGTQFTIAAADMHGRTLEILHKGRLSAGKNVVFWEPASPFRSNSSTSGMYIISMQGGAIRRSAVIPMVR